MLYIHHQRGATISIHVPLAGNVSMTVGGAYSIVAISIHVPLAGNVTSLSVYSLAG